MRWAFSAFTKHLDGSIGKELFWACLLAAGFFGVWWAWWVSYRVVNLPSFADFLIAVEAEMNKVSWPTRGELFRASMVVLICIIFLAIILFGYDIFWQMIFRTCWAFCSSRNAYVSDEPNNPIPEPPNISQEIAYAAGPDPAELAAEAEGMPVSA